MEADSGSLCIAMLDDAVAAGFLKTENRSLLASAQTLDDLLVAFREMHGHQGPRTRARRAADLNCQFGARKADGKKQCGAGRTSPSPAVSLRRTARRATVSASSARPFHPSV